MLEEVKQILEHAVWAPSGDNSQPWEFVWTGDTLKIFNLPGRDLPFYNYEQRGSYIAHGALIENIFIAASHFGLQPELQLFPGIEDNLVAEIKFFPTTKIDSELFPYIKLRQTNRRPYDSIVLEATVLNELAQTVSNQENSKVLFITNQEQKAQVAKNLSLNERIVLETKEAHAQFFNHVVWSKEEERSKKTGLLVDGLELKPPQKFIFGLAKSWSVIRILNVLGLSKLVSSDNSKVYAQSSALGVIVCSENRPESFIEAGRILQRIWLKATKDGLSLHPVTGILFLAQRIESGNSSGLSTDQVQALNKAYAEVKRSFNAGSQHINFLFRLGKALKPSAGTSRFDPSINIKIN